MYRKQTKQIIFFLRNALGIIIRLPKQTTQAPSSKCDTLQYFTTTFFLHTFIITNRAEDVDRTSLEMHLHLAVVHLGEPHWGIDWIMTSHYSRSEMHGNASGDDVGGTRITLRLGKYNLIIASIVKICVRISWYLNRLSHKNFDLHVKILDTADVYKTSIVRGN